VQQTVYPIKSTANRRRRHPSALSFLVGQLAHQVHHQLHSVLKAIDVSPEGLDIVNDKLYSAQP
jgi:hypothetical protein